MGITSSFGVSLAITVCTNVRDITSNLSVDLDSELCVSRGLHSVVHSLHRRRTQASTAGQ